jgi:hypothetical protein
VDGLSDRRAPVSAFRFSIDIGRSSCVLEHNYNVAPGLPGLALPPRDTAALAYREIEA